MEIMIDTNPQLKKRSEVHWARKIWHITAVFSMFAIYSVVTDFWAIAILGVAWLIFVPIDVLRQNNPKLNELALKVLGPIMRQSEVDKLAGTTYLLSGVFLILLLLPRPVVSLAILYLAFADPLASFVGIKYGKDKIFGHKSVQGFLAAFVVCFIVSIIYLSVNPFIENVLVFSILASLVGALSELIPIGKIDDNFTMPVLSGLGLYVLSFFLGVV